MTQMQLFDLSDMQFNDYEWHNYEENDPRISGTPDKTPFDPHDGGQVLYLINAVSAIWNLKMKQSGLKLERMLRCLPRNIRHQETVQEWLRKNWEKY